MPFKWIQNFVRLVSPPPFLNVARPFKEITSVNRGYVHKAPPPQRGGGWRVYSPGGGGGRGFIMHVPSSADLVALAVKGGEEDVISNCGPRGFSVIYLYSQYCRFYFYEQNFSKNVKKK